MHGIAKKREVVFVGQQEPKKHELAEADYIAGMKYKDIAEKYGVTINTVKSWKTRYKWTRKKKAHKNTRTRKKNSRQKRKVIACEIKAVMDNYQLNDKQRLFCVYYVKCFNATKAYQKAYGCSYAAAMSSGSQLLRNPKIREEIEFLKQNKLNREFLKTEDIFQKYMDIAFADITDYVEFGNEEFEYLDSDNKVRKGKASHLNVKNDYEVDGTIVTEISEGKSGIKVKLADRMKALEWLSEHMDMATEEQRARIDSLHNKVDIDRRKIELEEKKFEKDDW